MELKEYFDNKKGIGVLATADSEGRVNAAVYSRPHFMDDGNIAFIMADRLTHKNLQSNPHAVYLFKEDGDKYVGKRLYLTKIKEEQNGSLIDKIRRKREYKDGRRYETKSKFLVYFKIDKVLPLVGSK